MGAGLWLVSLNVHYRDFRYLVPFRVQFGLYVSPVGCSSAHVQDMRSLYAASDVVILPSWREGLSRSLVEAAAMERPIITTDVPGCSDVVEHGRSGLLVPIHDARGLELAIRLLLKNPDLARRFGKAARERVVMEFQVAHVNDLTLARYSQLLGSPSQISVSQARRALNAGLTMADAGWKQRRLLHR